MDKVQRNTNSSLTILGLCSAMMLSHAWAAPPPSRAMLQRNVSATVNQPVGPSTHPLDLRLPAMMSNLGKFSEGLPSLSRHAVGADTSIRALLPALGGAGAQHIPSKAELLAKNFRREGLPLAKLWQNQDSLVHLGLNPKGKPGLWLIQKLH